MKLVKSLLLGSAAGFCVVAGAQAADLPVRKAAPVEYVRVCSAHGAGFFYIPGTDTCLRVGGRARFEYQYTQNYNRQNDVSGFRGLGRIQLDARTSTSYGTLRTFIRFEIASRTGAYLTSGTQQRYANAFFGTGQDTYSRMQKYVQVDKAFIQFAGFTAGVASSFFDFYAHDLELIASSIGSDVSSTNLLAYTATFGNGFSATASMEDPTYRRNPIAAASGVAGFAVTGVTGATVSSGNVILGSSSFSPVAITRDAAGNPLTVANLDVTQRNRMPDFVGNLRWDQPWGSAQVSGAVHELAVGKFSNSGLTAPTGTTLATGTYAADIPDNSYGFGVQGGLKINLPQLAPGDVLWLQAAYASGAGSYTGIFVPQGSELNASGNTSLLGTTLNTGASGFDAAVDSAGRIHQTESYSATIAFLHYWTPEIRQGVFGTWGRAHFDGALRSSTLSPLIGQFGLANYASTVSTANGTSAALNTFAKDYNNIYVGSNLVWSPVRDLDIGVEAVYQRIELLGNGLAGRFIDQSKLGSGKTQAYEDNVMVRMRVQRDF